MRSLHCALKGIEQSVNKECYFVHKLEITPTLFPAIKKYCLRVYRYDINKDLVPTRNISLRYSASITAKSTTQEELSAIEEKLLIEIIRLIVTDMFILKNKESVTESILT